MSAFAGVDAMEVLHQAMRVAENNHRVIANNIANADTPGYNAVQMDFQQTLRSAIKQARSAPLRSAQSGRVGGGDLNPKLLPLASVSKNDYNKVDIDAELVRLSENTGNFTMYSSLLAKKCAIVKNVLSTLR